MSKGTLFSLDEPSSEVDLTLARARIHLCARICELGPTDLLEVDRCVTRLLIEAPLRPQSDVIHFPVGRPRR